MGQARHELRRACALGFRIAFATIAVAAMSAPNASAATCVYDTAGNPLICSQPGEAYEAAVDLGQQVVYCVAGTPSCRGSAGTCVYDTRGNKLYCFPTAGVYATVVSDAQRIIYCVAYTPSCR